MKQLLEGVVLDDDSRPVNAKGCVQLEDRQIEMTIVEGRYHQVKRMIAAVGNHVLLLHRVMIGSYELPRDLEEGQWRWLTMEDRALLGKNHTE